MTANMYRVGGKVLLGLWPVSFHMFLIVNWEYLIKIN